MKTRFGNILYAVGLIGAAASLLFAVEAIWVHQSGRSFLSAGGRFVSRQDMLTSIGIGVVAALVFWAVGTLARSALQRSAGKRKLAK